MKILKKGLFILFICFCLLLSFYYIFKTSENNILELDSFKVTKRYLTPNRYSRSQIKLSHVNGVVVHYTANPGSSAMDNRNYFEGLKDNHKTKASAHYIIGIKGEIVQCIPLNEIAYASNNRNRDTIAIECCHKDKSGKFTKETLSSLRQLLQELMNTYNLSKNNIIRHYDVTGKICPKYFVDHPDEWEKFKDNLDSKEEKKVREIF